LGERVLSRHLKEAGYTTGHFGKYINGHWDNAGSVGHVPAYWDVWRETTGGGPNEREVPHSVNMDGTIAQTLPGFVSAWSARQCAKFIRARAGSPWFAQYCPTIPHDPYTPTQSSSHLYDGVRRRSPSVNEKKMGDKPAWMRDLKPASSWWTQKSFEGQKEELADLDRYGIRPIVEALRATGQLANTVIFFTSDNGYMHGEHRLKMKDKPYWESAEVPFFVKGPGVKATDRSVLVNHTDLMPTTCEIAGIKRATLHVDGRSMLPNLDRGHFTGWRKRMLVSASNTVGPEMNPGGYNDPSGKWWLLREGNTAFILRESGAKELYWMCHDPHQLRNRAWDVKPSIRERLTSTVEAMQAASGEERRRLEEV
jgi:N-acetylglucosamine-6-sulfatase